MNGTHAIASALFAAVGPGELLMPLMGAPYDTLRTAIGITGDAYGSLAFYGVKYAEVPTKDGGPDLAAIEREVGEKRPPRRPHPALARLRQPPRPLSGGGG